MSARHNLEIKNNTMTLDGLDLKGIVNYRISNSAPNKYAELEIKMHVNLSKFVSQERTN
ncbi:hypothetical protein [Halalkalibacter hemicellulosilyticus]|uniref:hypothetical protein n=1 Tax=Halalkalibacter hemicellulosilyticus TaxID=127886 RepID=UPI000B2C0626|nr:hypothetical protein [Halalkalibacter hemicellulosilyticus]